MTRTEALSYIVVVIVFFTALPSIAYIAARGGL